MKKSVYVKFFVCGLLLLSILLNSVAFARNDEEIFLLNDPIKADEYADVPDYKNTQEDASGQKSYSDLKDTIYDEAAIALSELNVLSGYEDGNFGPENMLTRAEFATVAMRLITPGKEATGNGGAKVFFSDVTVNHWAFGNISAATELGLIGGFGDSRFLPDNPVTYNQAVKMLVCALGYGQQGEEKGGYPYGYLLEAVELGITKSVTIRFENNINRGIMLLLINNALDIPMKNGGITPRQLKSGVYATYYISPDGSDNNPGTEEKPWKTMCEAVKKIKAGSVLILEDGEYFEEKLTLFENSGTEFAPIVIKARNKHKAKLIYSKDLVCMSKFDLAQGVSYITVEDIAFSQEEIAKTSDVSPTGDILLRILDGSNIIVRGNYFENVYEEGIKLHRADNCIIEDNIIVGSIHEGMDGVNCANLIVRNNKVIECGRCGIMFKGGTRDSLIYNNLVYNKDVTLSDGGITVGGSTDKNSTYDIGAGTGFEMYNCHVYNNIVYSPTSRIRWGMLIWSAKDTRVFNNIVMGTSVASIRIGSNMGTKNGWKWDAPNRNVESYNNVFKDSPLVYEFINEPENFVSDYNIFDSIGSPPEEKNSKYSDPRFVSPKDLNFSLTKNSPAIGAGLNIPVKYIGFDNTEKSIIPIDWNGKERNSVWDIGVFQVSE